MDGDSKGSKVHETYHVGLRNMHALEMSAIEMTKRQAERLQKYPEMKIRLEQHHTESQEHAQRLEGILARHDASVSAVKNTVTSVMGNVAAAVHMSAEDEVLKNTLANFAFEHQEIAAYLSLIAMAEYVGDSAAVPILQRSLNEEQAMADWIKAHIARTTNQFLDLTAEGKHAGT